MDGGVREVVSARVVCQVRCDYIMFSRVDAVANLCTYLANNDDDDGTQHVQIK